MVLRRRALAVVAFAVIAFAVVTFVNVCGDLPRALAQAQSTKRTIRSIRFEGREWIERDKLLDASGLSRGVVWNDERLDAALRGLLATGLLREVHPPVVTNVPNGECDVVFRILERSLVQGLDIVGNESVSTKSLRERVLIGPGTPLREGDLERDVAQLLELLHFEGFLLGDATAETTRLGPGKVRVEFRIREGRRFGIGDVEIEGNEAISDSEILVATGLRPRKLFGILDRGAFLPSQLDAGLLSLRELYRSRGYVEVLVDLEDIVIDESRREVNIRLRVEEGPQFTLERVRLEGNKIFGDDLLLPELGLETGRPISRERLEKAARRLVDVYQERSDRVPRTSASLRYDEEGTGATALFEIDEREHLFVGAVEVSGNWRTLDRVVLANARVLPGNALTLFTLEDTERRIRNLGLFESVEVRARGTDRNDVRDVIIDVEERTEIGSWEIGGGAGSGEGGVAYFRVEHPNLNITKLPASWNDWSGAFVGGGQSVSLEFIPGTRESEFRSVFVEPYFFSIDRALFLRGAGLIYDRGPYDETRVQGEVEVRQSLGFDDRLSAGLTWRVEGVEIDKLAPNAPATVARDRGHTFLSFPRASLRYADLDNNVYSGLSGWRAELFGDYSDDWTGSEADFARVHLEADVFIPFFDRVPDLRHTLHAGFRSGWSGGLDGARVPFFENWFVGGPRSFRGFEYRGLGPHQAREPIGGRALFDGTVEYSAPLFLREVRLVGLFDYGFLEQDWGDVSTGRIRTAAGGGVQIRVPLLGQVVPFNLYFTHALSEELGDREQLFSFTFGYGL